MYVAVFMHIHKRDTKESFGAPTTQNFETVQQFEATCKFVKDWKTFEWATLMDSKTGKAIKTVQR